MEAQRTQRRRKRAKEIGIMEEWNGGMIG